LVNIKPRLLVENTLVAVIWKNDVARGGGQEYCLDRRGKRDAFDHQKFEVKGKGPAHCSEILVG